MRWENCTGIGGLFEVPSASAQSVIPEEFEGQGLTSQTVNFNFVAVECRRVATDQAVFENQSLFRVTAQVDPLNGSWAGNRSSAYVVDFFTTSPELVEASADLGVGARLVVLERTIVQNPQGGAAEHWKFVGEGFAAELELVYQGARTVKFDHEADLWNAAPDGFRKIDFRELYWYDDPLAEPGVLRVSGSAGTAAALAASCCAAFAAQPFFERQEVWISNETNYRA